jgi:hypothetical protein
LLVVVVLVERVEMRVALVVVVPVDSVRHLLR